MTCLSRRHTQYTKCNTKNHGADEARNGALQNVVAKPIDMSFAKKGLERAALALVAVRSEWGCVLAM